MTSPPVHSPTLAARFVVFGALASLWACASIPPGRAAVDSVQIVGARAVDPQEILDKLATAASPKFLGLAAGVANDFTIYDPSVLQRDLARVERYYQGRGFFEVHVRTSRIFYERPDHVRIVIAVEEGPSMHNRVVQISGLDTLEPTIAAEVAGEAKRALPPGARFDEDAYQKARTIVERALSDRGYAYASVTADARADLATHSVDYTLAVKPGARAYFGPITFLGLDPDGTGPAPQEIAEPLLRRVAGLRRSRPYSTSELESATQALLDLGVFSAVEIVPSIADPTQTVVPIAVRVKPAKLRTLRLGIGSEFDPLKTDVHAIFGWSDRNFLGDLRSLSIDFTPGVVLYPLTATVPLQRPDRYFLEERLRVQLRQPGFLEHRTTGFVRPELNTYPFLVEQKPTSLTQVAGFVEPKTVFGVERRFGSNFFSTISYNVQGELPIHYPGPPPEYIPPVFLTFPQWVTQLDFRDDQIHPHAGLVIDNDIQVATSPGTAADLRIQPDMEIFVPIARGVTFAVKGSLGLLFPFNYGTTVQNNLPDTPTTDEAKRDIETVYLRGFFLGGPSSNRGYPLREVAPHGLIPFLVPASARITTTYQGNCDPASPHFDAIHCAIPLPVGGFTMWAASAEVRWTVAGPLGLAAFCDSGDVAPQTWDFRWRYLHLACGMGARYDTPVGPARLDVGYRIQPLQRLGFPDESSARDPTRGGNATFGSPNLPTILDIPMAISFGIGEAF